MGSSQRDNRDSENSQIAHSRKCFLLVFILAQCRPGEVSSKHGPIPSPAFPHQMLASSCGPSLTSPFPPTLRPLFFLRDCSCHRARAERALGHDASIVSSYNNMGKPYANKYIFDFRQTFDTSYAVV